MIKIFLHGAGIEQDAPDNIAIGSLKPHFSQAGMESVLKVHIEQIDRLISLLPDGSSQKTEAWTIRGFSYSEYLQLFQAGIREVSYKEYPIFNCLGITTAEQRRRLIYHISESYGHYLSLLLHSCHAFRLSSFFFPTRFDGSYEVQCTYPHRRKDWCGKIEAHGTDVVRCPKEITKRQEVQHGIR